MIFPKVSICIPTYKEPELLKECLDSISMQTYTNYELIITDDSPDDSIEKVVENFKGKINNLSYFKNMERKGSPGNWNESIRKAQGEYIKIIHHDDKFSGADSLSSFVTAADNNPGADLLFCSSEVYDIRKDLKYFYIPNKNKIKSIINNPLSLLIGNIVGAPSVTFFKKNNEIFDKNLKWLVDIDFYIRLLKKNSKAVFIAEPLIHINIGANQQISGKCRNKKVEFTEWFYVYKKYKPGERFTLREKFHILKLLYKYKIRSITELKEITELSNEKTLRTIIRINNYISYVISK